MPLSDSLYDFRTGHYRHTQICYNEIGAVLIEIIKGFLAVGAHGGYISYFFKDN